MAVPTSAIAAFVAQHKGNDQQKNPSKKHKVGEAFVTQYYNVLCHSTHLTYRFYTDESCLSRAGVGDGVVQSVTTMAAIHEKIMSTPQADLRTEILSIDCQQSLGDGVVVMVTGVQPGGAGVAEGLRRKFTQTFFLAPQEKGFFVLNDMLRFLDRDEPAANGSYVSHEVVVENREYNEPLCNVPPEHNEPEHIEPEHNEPQYDVSQYDAPQYNEPQYETPQYNEPQYEAPQYNEPQYEAPQYNEVPQQYNDVPQYDIPRPVDSLELDQLPVTDSTSTPIVKHEESQPPSMPIPQPSLGVPAEKPKLSYASILRVMKECASAAEDVTRKPAPPVSTHRAFVSAPPPPSNHVADAPVAHSEDGKSLYVKNLPLDTTRAELEAEFGRFGPLAVNGINLRNEKPGVCFAFVEYEDPRSARNALNASSILIGGRPAHVEERKSISTTQAGRGRPGTGRGYQGSYGGRGSGGRGSGQNYDGNSNRGRRSGTNRGAAN